MPHGGQLADERDVEDRGGAASPTAERIFSDGPGIEVGSAGLASDAVTPLDAELVEWADVIFVMTRTHRSRLSQMFRSHLKGARIICLNVPDEFDYMQPELVEIGT